MLTFAKLQKDGSLSPLRQLDDIFEDAANKLAQVSEAETKKDLDTTVSQQDIMSLLKLDCIHKAARQVCEVNGMILDDPIAGRCSYTSRPHTRTCSVSL